MRNNFVESYRNCVFSVLFINGLDFSYAFTSVTTLRVGLVGIGELSWVYSLTKKKKKKETKKKS